MGYSKGKLRVTSRYMKHTHTPAAERPWQYPKNRKLSEDQEAVVFGLFECSAPHDDIRQFVTDMFSIVLTKDDVCRLKSKYNARLGIKTNRGRKSTKNKCDPTSSEDLNIQSIDVPSSIHHPTVMPESHLSEFHLEDESGSASLPLITEHEDGYKTDPRLVLAREVASELCHVLLEQEPDVFDKITGFLRDLTESMTNNGELFLELMRLYQTPSETSEDIQDSAYLNQPIPLEVLPIPSTSDFVYASQSSDFEPVEVKNDLEVTDARRKWRPAILRRS